MPGSLLNRANLSTHRIVGYLEAIAKRYDSIWSDPALKIPPLPSTLCAGSLQIEL